MHIPPGFTRLFPYVFADDAKAYLTFLADGLGGEVASVHEAPPGRLANAHVRFGDTTIMVSEATPANPATSGTYYLYVADADAAMARGIGAGGTQIGAVQDQWYGDRQGGLRDPWGNIWWLSQRLAAGGYDEVTSSGLHILSAAGDERLPAGYICDRPGRNRRRQRLTFAANPAIGRGGRGDRHACFGSSCRPSVAHSRLGSPFAAAPGADLP